jgi:hypothetical protein
MNIQAAHTLNMPRPLCLHFIIHVILQLIIRLHGRTVRFEASSFRILEACYAPLDGESAHCNASTYTVPQKHDIQGGSNLTGSDLCKQAALSSSCATLREWSHNLYLYNGKLN